MVSESVQDGSFNCWIRPPLVVPVATGTQGPIPISPRMPLTKDSGLDSGCGRKDGGIFRQLNDP